MRSLLKSVPKFINLNFNKSIFKGKFSGSALFVDISGFTKLTESLLQYKDKGVEEISRIVLYIFEPLISSVQMNGGFIAYFAGDALMAVFEDDDGSYARKAAGKIISWFEEKEKVPTLTGEVHLSVHYGIGVGNYQWGICRSKTTRYCYYFKGQAIDRAVLDAQKKGEGRGKITEKSVKRNIKTSMDLSRDIDLVRKFEDENIIRAYEKPEMRDIITIFFQFSDINQHLEIEQLYSVTEELLREYGGTFNKLIFGDKGMSMLIIFGAPVALEKPEERAIDFILKFKDIFKQKFPDRKWRAGLTRGPVYVGLTGGRMRNEWTALGDSVNTSARLMMISKWNSLTVTENIEKKLVDYLFNDLGKVRLKGKKSNTHIFSLNSRVKHFEKKYITGFINREDEQKWLVEKLNNVSEGKFGGIFLITGDSGIGKTRLVEHVMKDLDIFLIKMSCSSVSKRGFSPVREWLYVFFNLNGKDDRKKVENKIKTISENPEISNEIAEELIRNTSFLAALVYVEWEGSIYSSLDPKLRFENQLRALKTLIKAISTTKPLLLFVDDSQFMDEFTSQWLKMLTRNVESFPFGIVLTSWEIKNDAKNNLSDIKFDDILHLNPLEEEKIYTEITKKYLKGEASDSLIEFLKETGKGNPLFLEQLVMHLNNTGILEISKSGKLNLIEKPEKVPESLSDLLTARFDRLDEGPKELLKHASVIGNQFNRDLLNEVLSVSPYTTGEIQKYLMNCLDEGIIVQNENIKNVFRFRTPLLKDTAYSLQLPSRRIKLHLITGDKYEKKYSGEISKYYDDLVFQFNRAEDYKKEEKYLPLAADRAKESFENEKAINYNERWNLILDENDEISVEKKYKALSSIGYIYSLIGKINKAVDYFYNALEVIKISGKNENKIDLLVSISDLYRRNSEFEKSLDKLNLAEKLSKKINNKKLLCEVYNTSGLIYSDIGKIQKSLDYYNKALKISKEIKNRKLTAMITGNMGIVYSKDDLETAYKCFKEHLSISEELNDRRNKVNALNNLGIISAYKKDFISAEKYFLYRLKILKEVGDLEGIAISYENLANLNKDMQKPKKAVQFLDIAIENYKELDNINELVRTYLFKIEILIENLNEDNFLTIENIIEYLINIDLKQKNDNLFDDIDKLLENRNKELYNFLIRKVSKKLFLLRKKWGIRITSKK